jgi:hypothetical protein
LRLCAQCIHEAARNNFFRALKIVGLDCDRVQTQISFDVSDRYTLNLTKGNRTCTISGVPPSILEAEGNPDLEQLVREIASFLKPKWSSWQDS